MCCSSVVVWRCGAAGWPAVSGHEDLGCCKLQKLGAARRTTMTYLIPTYLRHVRTLAPISGQTGSKKNHTVVPNSYLQFCLARFIPKCLEPCLNGGRTGSKKNHTVVPNSYLHVGICQVLFGALHHQNALNFT